MTPLHAALTAVAAVAGAAVGLAGGWLSVYNERAEGLEQEYDEDLVAYEADVKAAREEAAGEGKPMPRLPAWEEERHGWTWLERYLNPLLVAASWGIFVGHAQELTAALLFQLVWLAVLAHITIFDLKHRLILDRVTLPAIVAALVASHFTPDLGVGHALFGAVAIFVFFYGQSLIVGGRMLGVGDSKLGAFIGATTGLGLDANHFGAIYAICAGIIIAGIVAILLLVTRVRGLKEAIPYGPWLCAGAALVMFSGPVGP